MKSMKLVVILLCELLALNSAWADSLYTLVVEVRGAENTDGQFLLSLFDSEEAFLDEPFYTSVVAIDNNGQGNFQVNELQAGIYAASVVHDEDGDGELDTRLFGIPKEKVGVSNNPRPRFGPPGFEDAAFELNEDMRLEIRLSDAE